MRSRYSQTVADLFPETRGMVQARDIPLAETIEKLFKQIAFQLGEAEARRILAEAAPQLKGFVPTKRGRSQGRRDRLIEAELLLEDSIHPKDSAAAIAKRVHGYELVGKGMTVEAMTKRLNRLRKKKQKAH